MIVDCWREEQTGDEVATIQVDSYAELYLARSVTTLRTDPQRWAYVRIGDETMQVIAHEVSTGRCLAAPVGEPFHGPIEEMVDRYDLIRLWLEELYDGQ